MTGGMQVTFHPIPHRHTLDTIPKAYADQDQLHALKIWRWQKALFIKLNQM